MSTKIISVDPGVSKDPRLSGAICLMNLKGEVEELFPVPHKKYPMSKKGKTKVKVNMLELSNKLKSLRLTDESFIVIEEVTAMPGQGVTSMFSFGETFGTIKGLLYKYSKYTDLNTIRPQKWKKHFKLGSDKEKVIEECKRLYPNVCLKASARAKKDSSGMAEAVLLGKYFLDCELKKHGII